MAQDDGARREIDAANRRFDVAFTLVGQADVTALVAPGWTPDTWRAR